LELLLETFQGKVRNSFAAALAGELNIHSYDGRFCRVYAEEDARILYATYWLENAGGSPEDVAGQIQKLFLEELKRITPEAVREAQRLRQMGRGMTLSSPSSFETEAGACLAATQELSHWGRIRSWHEREEQEDETTVEEVLLYRDLLFTNPAFVCYIHGRS
jgi:hypothetical protein